jgi:hypothetical protein
MRHMSSLWAYDNKLIQQNLAILFYNEKEKYIVILTVKIPLTKGSIWLEHIRNLILRIIIKKVNEK